MNNKFNKILTILWICYFFDNGLNVEYISDFMKKADRYLREMLTLHLLRPNFRIFVKDVKPKRLLLAYGDIKTNYAFSGTRVQTLAEPGIPWSPLMIELCDKMKKKAYPFKYVLLNFYQGGSTCISHHKDKESCLNGVLRYSVLMLRELLNSRDRMCPQHL